MTLGLSYQNYFIGTVLDQDFSFNDVAAVHAQMIHSETWSGFTEQLFCIFQNNFVVSQVRGMLRL